MLRFTSSRERRLWGWALVVVVGIYATLGVAQVWAEMLRDRNLLDAGFVVGMVLVVVAILVQGLRARPGGFEIGVALGVVGAYLILFLRLAIPEARSHLIEYSVVALLIHEALLERARPEGGVLRPALLALLATALLGTLDECIQAVVPNRVFDVRDVLFNVLAAGMAVGAGVVFGWARRRRRPSPRA